MKVLVRGNLVARKGICSMKCADFADMHYNVVVDKDTDYDLVIYGDTEIDGLMVNGAELYVTGNIIALGKE